MKKIVRITESDINRIVKKILNETTPSAYDCSKKDARLVDCGSFGIKSMGCCEKSTQRMVRLCKEKFPDSKLFGYCYDDTKEVKPLPSSNSNQSTDWK